MIQINWLSVPFIRKLKLSTEKDDGMISFAPIIVYYDADEGDVPLEHAGGGGGCFIDTAIDVR
jgi:hypothetical protein